MKLKSLIIGFCLSFCASAFAGNQHLHPQATTDDSQLNKPASTDMKWPGYCEIEVINNSYDNVTVYGVFDDGVVMDPFNVYSFESPHYISLYYYGYCHQGMNLYIDTWSGYHLYSGYTTRRSTVRIVPYLTNQVKAEVQSKE